MTHTKKPSAWAALGAVALVISVGLSVCAFIMMFCLGALHKDWAAAPALGYWDCVVAAVLLNTMGSAWRMGTVTTKS